MGTKTTFGEPWEATAEDLKKSIGFVEDGDTASRAIASGAYVIWKGKLCTADSAISSGDTLATSGSGKNLTLKPNGGLNDLNSKMVNIERFQLTTNANGWGEWNCPTGYIAIGGFVESTNIGLIIGSADGTTSITRIRLVNVHTGGAAQVTAYVNIACVKNPNAS